MDRVKMLNDWLADNKYSRRKLSLEINMSVTIISNATSIKNRDNPIKYAKFWNAVRDLTGIEAFGVGKTEQVNKIEPEIPENIERMLRLHNKTVIDKRIYKRIGKEKLLKYFADKGLNCKVKIEQDECGEPYHYLEVVGD